MSQTMATFRRAGQRAAWLASAFASCLALAGCKTAIPLASQQSIADAPRRYATHTFSFDTNGDKPAVQILDFHYGGSNFPGVRGCPPAPKPCAGPFRSTLAFGRMEVAEQLFVEWMNERNGTVYRDVVSLGQWLPRDMEGARVHLMIDWGIRAAVFLVGPGRSAEGTCPDMKWRARLLRSQSALGRVMGQFCHLTIVQIYPRNIYVDKPEVIGQRKDMQ